MRLCRCLLMLLRMRTVCGQWRLRTVGTSFPELALEVMQDDECCAGVEPGCLGLRPLAQRAPECMVTPLSHGSPPKTSVTTICL